MVGGRGVDVEEEEEGKGWVTILYVWWWWWWMWGGREEEEEEDGVCKKVRERVVRRVREKIEEELMGSEGKRQRWRCWNCSLRESMRTDGGGWERMGCMMSL